MRKSKWVEVSPLTMPERNIPVIVKVKNKKADYYIDIMKSVLWFADVKKWGWLKDEKRIYMGDTMVVTHWMPYPKPADD